MSVGNASDRATTTSLMIVDDERLTRTGLQTSIDWKALGIGTVTTAKDGREALLLMQDDVPDILLCDVRMPRMNGIELATHVRTHHPQCRIIFMSGYSDKEYLKAAIRLKAESYVEKPLDIGELNEVLAEVVRQREAEPRTPGSGPLGLSVLAGTSQIIKQEIVAELISGQSGGYVTIRSRFYPVLFTWEESSEYFAVCLSAGPSKDFPKLERDLLRELTAHLDGRKAAVRFDYLAGQIGGDGIAVLFNHADRTGVREILDSVKKALENKFRTQVAAGMSSRFGSLKDAAAAWNEAKECCELSFYFGRSEIYAPQSHKHELADSPDPSLFETGPVNFQGLERLFGTLAQTRPSCVAAVKRRLFELYRSVELEATGESVASFSEFRRLTLAEVQERIVTEMNSVGPLAPGSRHPKVAQTVNYIRWHYNDINISVKSLARTVGLSQNYLSSLFRQDTGITVNDYLVEVRIKKAQQLLLETDLRIYEIALKVGIGDPNYLSDLFKRKTGLTPLQFRQASTTQASATQASATPASSASPASSSVPDRDRVI